MDYAHIHSIFRKPKMNVFILPLVMKCGLYMASIQIMCGSNNPHNPHNPD